MFGHRKASEPPTNSSDRRPTPAPTMRRMKDRRLSGPLVEHRSSTSTGLWRSHQAPRSACGQGADVLKRAGRRRLPTDARAAWNSESGAPCGRLGRRAAWCACRDGERQERGDEHQAEHDADGGASSSAPASARATIAPPTPAPNAVPSVNMSWSAAELKPSSPGRRGLEHEQSEHRVGEPHAEPGDGPADGRHAASACPAAGRARVIAMPARDERRADHHQRAPDAGGRRPAPGATSGAQVTAAAESASAAERDAAAADLDNGERHEGLGAEEREGDGEDGRPRPTGGRAARRSAPGGSRWRRRAKRQPAADYRPAPTAQGNQADGQRGEQQRRADREAHGVERATRIAPSAGSAVAVAGPRRASCG